MKIKERKYEKKVNWKKISSDFTKRIRHISLHPHGERERERERERGGVLKNLDLEIYQLNENMTKG